MNPTTTAQSTSAAPMIDVVTTALDQLIALVLDATTRAPQRAEPASSER